MLRGYTSGEGQARTDFANELSRFGPILLHVRTFTSPPPPPHPSLGQTHLPFSITQHPPHANHQLFIRLIRATLNEINEMSSFVQVKSEEFRRVGVMTRRCQYAALIADMRPVIRVIKISAERRCLTWHFRPFLFYFHLNSAKCKGLGGREMASDVHRWERWSGPHFRALLVVDSLPDYTAPPVFVIPSGPSINYVFKARGSLLALCCA